MKKNKKLIDLYKEWMETDELPYSGLCSAVPNKYQDALDMISPSIEESLVLTKENKPIVYWGCGVAYSRMPDYQTIGCYFSPLRQTIVLLICAIHNEL